MEQEITKEVPTQIINPDGTIDNHCLLYQFTGEAGAGQRCQDFIMQITDPENPLLLFDYKLSPMEYPQIRDQMHLFCEFSGFPDIVNDLLSQCLDDNNYKSVVNNSDPRKPYFQIQQSTHINLVFHMTLVLKPATDERMKEFLSKETMYYKGLTQKLETNLQKIANERKKIESENNAQYEELLDQFNQAKSEHAAEVKALKEKLNKTIEDFRNQHANELEQLNQKHMEKNSELINKYEQQIKEERNKLETETHGRHDLSVQNATMSEKIASLEARLKDTKTSLEEKETEIKNLQASNTNLQADNAKLLSQLSESTARNEALQQNLHDKNSIVQNNDSMVEELKSQLAEKKQEIVNLQQTIAEFSTKAQERDWIADKSKLVIKKNQDKINKLLEHYNDKKKQLEKQIKENQDLQLEKVKAEQEVLTLSKVIEQEREQSNILNKKIQDLKKELEEMKKKDNDDKQLIAFLEKQVNEKEQENFDLKSEFADEIPSLNNSSFRFSGHTSPIRKGAASRGPDYINSFNFPETESLFDQAPEFY